MSDDFHKVLYAFARRKVAKTLGVDGDDAGGAEEDPDARTERKQRIVRERKRMIAAIQTARIAYQARLIMETTAQRERQPGRVGARGSTDTRTRRRKLVFLIQGGFSLKKRSKSNNKKKLFRTLVFI